MPMPCGPDGISHLPLWAQVLSASRMVRRAAVMCDASEREIVEATCDAIDACAKEGGGISRVENALAAGRELVERGSKSGAATAEALRWAIDAARAAEAALDFPIDAIVTRSAQNAIAAIAQNRRVSTIQLGILLASDVDLLGFACGEARVGTYDGLTEQVMGRLTPVHGLTLAEGPTASVRS